MTLVDFALKGVVTAAKSTAVERAAGQLFVAAEERLGCSKVLVEEANLASAARQLFVRTGSPTYVDLSEAGPLSFACLKDPAREFWPKVPDGWNSVVKPRYIDATSGLRLDANTLPISVRQPTYWSEHPFYSKVNQPGKFALRESATVSEPIVNLDLFGRVDSLAVPLKTSARDLSEVMAITSSAKRIFSDVMAERAAQFVTRESVGFKPQLVEVAASSPAEMFGYALKGSRAWIEGGGGNNYTRYLKDWHGEFSAADRKVLHELFTGKMEPISNVPHADIVILAER